jgi:hypothetical protein
MRFCPFCAKENTDEAEHCAHCGKKLPRARPASLKTRSAPQKTLFGVGELKNPPGAPVPPADPPPGATIRGTAAPSRKITAAEVAEKTSPNQKQELSPLPVPAAPAPEPAPNDNAMTVPTPMVDLADLNPPEEAPIVAPRPAPRVADRPTPIEPILTPLPTPIPSIPTPSPVAIPIQPYPQAPSARAPSGKLPPPDDGYHEPKGDDYGAPSSVIVDQPEPTAPTEESPVIASAPQHRDAPPSSISVSHSQMVSTELAQPIDVGQLPPMPPAPPSDNIIGWVRYLYPVGRAWWARRAAQTKVRSALVGDQRQLDQVLGELGRAAREEKLELAALSEEMGHLAETEARKSKAETETADTNDEKTREAERFANLEAAANDAITEQEEVVRKADEALRAQVELRRGEQQDLQRVDGEIKALERKAAQLEVRAQKLAPNDPQRAGSEFEARSSRERALELEPERHQRTARVAELDAPVAELTKELADARLELSNRKRTLSATIADRTHAFAQLDAKLARLASDAQHASGEISRRFVTIGTLLNLNRVELPRFSPLYGRIDDLKSGLTEREALIARLDDERSAFDHGAIQKGLITVGATLGGLVIIAVVLILLLGGGSHRCATSGDCRADEMCQCDKDGCVDEKTFAARGKCISAKH